MCGHAAEDISNYKELFPSIFTARALTNCDMFTLSAEEFHLLVEEYPKVKIKLHAWAVRSAAVLKLPSALRKLPSGPCCHALCLNDRTEPACWHYEEKLLVLPSFI